MILKVQIGDVEWQFIPLKGAVTVSPNEGVWPPQPEYDTTGDGNPPIYPVPYTHCAFDIFLLDKQMTSGREIFPVVKDSEQSIIFNRDAYLLNNDGKTIEKIAV